MTREIIVSILEGEGAEQKGGALALPEDREATCFVSSPGELMNVARVVRVDLKDKFIVLYTAKDDRFAFVYEDILGFKLSGSVAVKERSAGFSR
jgi:hypothetical protein